MSRTKIVKDADAPHGLPPTPQKFVGWQLDPVGYDCRPGDIIVIPKFRGGNLDHALMVADTFPEKINVFTPEGDKAALSYVDLRALKAYFLWHRPVEGPPSLTLAE